MASVDEVAAQIRAGVQAAKRALTLLRHASQHLGQATQQIAAATASTTDPRPAAAVARLGAAVTKGRELHQQLAGAQRLADEYLAEITHGSGNDAGAGGAGPQAAAPQANDPYAGGQPPRPAQVDQLGARLPIRESGEPVAGYVIAPNGSAIQVRSGRNPDNVSDLRPGYRPLSWKHAEGRAARVIRKHSVRRADLVINADPCDVPQVGCRDTLPYMLPDGATLTIWVRRNDGTIDYFDTYTGNGRGIA